jgi:integrase
LADLVENDKKKEARDGKLNALLGIIPTLDSFSKEFLEWVEATHSIDHDTKRYYRNGWRLLRVTKLARMKLDQITNHACEMLKFPGGPSSANTALRTLRRMLSKAKELGKLQQVPKITLRKEWPRAVVMSMDKAKQIEARVKGNPRDAFAVMRRTGMRPKEVFCMRWECFVWERLYYQNPRGKTKSARRAVPLLGTSLEILKRRHVEAGLPNAGWVFPSAKAESGHMMTIAKAYTSARKAAGLPDAMVPYTARHGALTDLGSVVSLKTVMEVGGHSDAKTALRYQHPNVAELQQKLAAAQTNERVM